MRKKKRLQELTIKDNFMFGAVMTQEENARRFLEMVLGFPIARIEISKEKCFIYHASVWISSQKMKIRLVTM